MKRIVPSSRFQPTKHAIDQFRLRFSPNLSEEKAADLLHKLAKDARALKVSGRRN